DRLCRTRLWRFWATRSSFVTITSPSWCCTTTLACRTQRRSLSRRVLRSTMATRRLCTMTAIRLSATITRAAAVPSPWSILKPTRPFPRPAPTTTTTRSTRRCLLHHRRRSRATARTCTIILHHRHHHHHHHHHLLLLLLLLLRRHRRRRSRPTARTCTIILHHRHHHHHHLLLLLLHHRRRSRATTRTYTIISLLLLRQATSTSTCRPPTIPRKTVGCPYS
ncbi:hypothetical protein J3B02_003337, partial [Coemansia erecta]